MNTSIAKNAKNKVKRSSAKETRKPMMGEGKNINDACQWTVIETVNFSVFKGLEIEGIKQYEGGLCEPVEEGDKPDFISLYGRYFDGGRDCIADFKPEISENEIIEFCTKLAADQKMDLSVLLYDWE